MRSRKSRGRSRKRVTEAGRKTWWRKKKDRVKKNDEMGDKERQG